MENEFVDYKTALALKELGFDEPCMASRDMNNDEGLIQIPLKQQAFRWFREKHDIQTLIKKNKSDHVWYRYEVYFERLATGENPPVMVGHTINSWLGLNLEFNTYEEAEQACLDKLIEICKTK